MASFIRSSYLCWPHGRGEALEINSGPGLEVLNMLYEVTLHSACRTSRERLNNKHSCRIAFCDRELSRLGRWYTQYLSPMVPLFTALHTLTA